MLAAIPWTHRTLDVGEYWSWVTPLFTATVLGNEKSFYWRVVHTDGGASKPIGDANTASFQDAENQVRETIGKSYGPHSGYQEFVGRWANTFSIATSEDVDFSPFVDKMVVLTIWGENNNHTEYVGTLTIHNYMLHLATDTQVLEINPNYIMAVRLVQTTTHINTAKNLGGRTFEDNWVPGCSGTPGYAPNTVEHSGSECPIHEAP